MLLLKQEQMSDNNVGQILTPTHKKLEGAIGLGRSAGFHGKFWAERLAESGGPCGYITAGSLGRPARRCADPRRMIRLGRAVPSDGIQRFWF